PRTPLRSAPTWLSPPRTPLAKEVWNRREGKTCGSSWGRHQSVEECAHHFSGAGTGALSAAGLAGQTESTNSVTSIPLSGMSARHSAGIGMAIGGFLPPHRLKPAAATTVPSRTLHGATASRTEIKDPASCSDNVGFRSSQIFLLPSGRTANTNEPARGARS